MDQRWGQVRAEEGIDLIDLKPIFLTKFIIVIDNIAIR